MIATLAFIGFAAEAQACSCGWGGPFLTVAPKAPIIIRGVVQSYQGEGRGIKLGMDIKVLEVLKGRLAEPITRVWGSNGAQCRPYVSLFPVGTEWIFALNGPGSKPGMNNTGYAISDCGRYWLQVQKGEVVGNIDDAANIDAVQKRPLSELRRLLLAQNDPPSNHNLHIEAELKAGQQFKRNFGEGLCFILEPQPSGWLILVQKTTGGDDLARLSPPLHFVPNPRQIEGWHLLEEDASAKCANAPGKIRDFIFSPAVGDTIDGPAATRAVTPEDIENVRRYGQGKLTVLDFRLEKDFHDQTPAIEWMRFAVDLSWTAR